jgi:beta-lactamase superfamily II metal-dependent hydrolase
MKTSDRLGGGARWGVVLAIVICSFVSSSSAGQEARFLALQRPGQGSVAIDAAGLTAYITDLGAAGDGNKLVIDDTPLLDYFEAKGIRRLVFTCSHPHADHMGGIRALFEQPRLFFTDSAMTMRRFDSVVVVDDTVSNSLFDMLRRSLPASSGIKLSRERASNRNAFAGLSQKTDAVYVENVPYVAAEKAGPHGRSVVTRLVLGGQYTVLDFDDADSPVIRKVVDGVKASGTPSVDAFVVPHHGSAYHEIQPILDLKPKVAIIAVNPNNQFGHPTPEILLRLIDALGPENVIFTGSADHVVVGPNGVSQARYTAATPDSYELFIEASHRRALAEGRKDRVELFSQLKQRMLVSSTNASSESPTRKTLVADEIRTELDDAEQSIRDLFRTGNTLAKAADSAPPQVQEQLREAFTLQGLRLNQLRRHVATHKPFSGEELAAERLMRLAALIQHPLLSESKLVQTVTPFADSELRSLTDRVASVLSRLSARGRSATVEPSNPSAVRFAATMLSARKAEPVLSTWKATAQLPRMTLPSQIELPYGQLLSPKSAGARPGGILIGNVAQPEAGLNFADHVLRYDRNSQMLTLGALDGSVVRYQTRITGPALKSLYRFAASSRSSAVSLSGTDIPGVERLVRLDQAFLDSPVGRDLIAADLVAWRLKLETLPDGRPNPVASAFLEAESGLKSCVAASSRATLVDDATTVKLREGVLVLEGGVRMEFMADGVGLSGCDQRLCRPASSGSKACHLVELERLARANRARLRDLFPPLKRVDEYVRLVAFLRWALSDGNVAAVDLSALTGLQSASSRSWTPDALVSK